MTPAERNTLIVEMRRNGGTLDQIAVRFAISRTTVQRVLKPPRSDGEKAHGRPCPQCHGDSHTVDTRHRTLYTYRRHECLLCRFRWRSRQFDDVSREHTAGSVAHDPA